MVRDRLLPLAAAAACLAPVDALRAQAAVDPAMVPRALTLAREGRRADATTMLGRYLATATADGRAWLTIGRFYLLDVRDWHLGNHEATPGAGLLIDLAGSVLDQADRFGLDSAIVFRGLVEFERALLLVEERGWAEARERAPHGFGVPLPPFILELGYNLLNSCPAALGAGWRRDVQPFLPSLYAVDPRYRKRMADAFGVDDGLTVQQAMARVAEKRPLCLSPMADRAAAPLGLWAPVRLVLVAGPTDRRPPHGVLAVTALLEAQGAAASGWTADVREVYAAAARHNVLLCAGLLAPLGPTVEGCRK
jgi:hypothetical protein